MFKIKFNEENSSISSKGFQAHVGTVSESSLTAHSNNIGHKILETHSIYSLSKTIKKLCKNEQKCNKWGPPILVGNSQ